MYDESILFKIMDFRLFGVWILINAIITQLTDAYMHQMGPISVVAFCFTNID